MFNVEDIRKDFPMIKNNPDLVYFDSSATSFKPQCVIDAVDNYYTHINANIHRGDYDISIKASQEYDDARQCVATFINANSNKEIVFTNGATNSLNIVAYGYCLKNLKKGDVILTTQEEHASNILPLFRVCKLTGAEIKYIELNDDATFNLDNYLKCFENTNVKFISLAHISNVMGYINPIKEIVKIAHDHGAIVNVDAAQSVPHIKVDVQDLDVDFLSFSSHKMLGPSGIGILYGKYELLKDMEPEHLGGGSNARFESDGSVILKNAPEIFEAGTPNIEGVIGLKAAIQYLEKVGMNNIEEYTDELTKYFINELKKIDNVQLYNEKSNTGIVTFNLKGIFAQDAASYFNKNNIAVRTGNHCAKLLHNIIGATETIRASLYLYNTKEEIDKFIKVIKETTLEKCVDTIL